MLAFDFRRLGESGGEPRQIVRVGEQLADWEAAIAFARTLPGVDADRLAIWGFSLSGGHVFRVAARDPQLAAAIAQAPLADGQAAAPNAMRHMTPLAALRLTGRAVLDAVGGVFGREPLLVPLAGPPGTVASLPRPTAPTVPERSIPATGIRTGSRRSRPVPRCASASTGPAAPHPACGVRCWCSPTTMTGSAPPRPPPARRSAPLAVSSSACPAGTTRPSWAATRTAVEIQLPFLRRHLLDGAQASAGQASPSAPARTTPGRPD